MLVKIVLLALFIAVMAGVGVYCRKKAVDVSGFVLGSRNVGPWLTAFAYGTSYFSAVVFVGYAGQFGWNFGLSAVWIGLGNAFVGSLLAWQVMGRRTRLMTQHLYSATMPDFFGKRYDSKPIKLAASALIFVFLIPYSASVYKGLSRLFSMAFGLPFEYCIIGMAALTALYVILGGYMATAVNDFIQGIIMLAGITAVIFAALAQKGGVADAVGALSGVSDPAVPGMASPFTSVFGPNPVNLLGVVVLTSLGAWGLPQMVHKFYAIKNDKSIGISAVVSTAFAVVIAGGSYFLGAFGRIFYTAPEGGRPVFDDIVPFILSGLPDALIGVVLVLVLSASMSTLSSVVIASSSTLTVDFLKGLRRKDMPPKLQVALIRGFCAVFVLLSVLLAMDNNPNNIITSLMSWSWGALAGAFLGPFLYGLFWKGVTRAGVWASFASGVVITLTGFVIFYTKHNNEVFTGALRLLNSPINIGACAILMSLVVVPLVSMFTPRLDKSVTDRAFAALSQARSKE